jgi:anti-sigma factor RsiW
MLFWRRRRRAIVCRDAVALMADYLEGRLSSVDRSRLEEHLGACEHCSEYLAQLRLTIDALGHADPDALGDEALDELVGLYRQWRAEK